MQICSPGQLWDGRMLQGTNVLNISDLVFCGIFSVCLFQSFCPHYVKTFPTTKITLCNMPGGLWLRIPVFSVLLSLEYLASLIKMNRLSCLHTSWNCTCGFSFLVFYRRTWRGSPRNLNCILRNHITTCHLKKEEREWRKQGGKVWGKEREYYGMSFCFLPACKQILLLLFFVVFFFFSLAFHCKLTSKGC